MSKAIKPMNLGVSPAELEMLNDLPDYERIMRLNLLKIHGLHKCHISAISDPAIKAKIEGFAETPQSLCLTGGVGAGKSFAVRSLLREYVMQGVDRIVSCTEMTLFDILKRYGYEDMREGISRAIVRLVDPLRRGGVLYIDDIGRGMETSWVEMVMPEILDICEERDVILLATTNNDIDTFKKTRTHSRMKGLCEMVNYSRDDVRSNKLPPVSFPHEAPMMSMGMGVNENDLEDWGALAAEMGASVLFVGHWIGDSLIRFMEGYDRDNTGLKTKGISLPKLLAIYDSNGFMVADTLYGGNASEEEPADEILKYDPCMYHQIENMPFDRKERFMKNYEQSRTGLIGTVSIEDARYGWANKHVGRFLPIVMD